MKLFIDTFVFVRLSVAPHTVSQRLLTALSDRENACLASPASLYEIAWKARRNALPADVAGAFERALETFAVDTAPIDIAAMRRAAALPSDHRDPFDRIIAAQALIADALVVSPDRAFDALGTRRVWG